jgi:hypothetical protein
MSGTKFQRVVAQDIETQADLARFAHNDPDVICISGQIASFYIELGIEEGRLAEVNQRLLKAGFVPYSGRARVTE